MRQDECKCSECVNLELRKAKEPKYSEFELEVLQMLRDILDELVFARMAEEAKGAQIERTRRFITGD